ncbi:TetR/AcrR family transcriptional regulator C-terminal domain-containing protein [Kribbella solani]|uniref:TetR/AcrR family transcriptional regulator C-terminal domain-containing protein n=1 Tax=Kribbella solani TaxID=236067 RepID=UPI0029AC4D6A|nr:TetR/AcrR family transcriptional regulator C-terminal domain-containing protein [Kribbella solani]MDX2972960.1 TetR/AcrR family transcriptional regulator C-terminal domain-containing protein [Kribbella solani]
MCTAPTRGLPAWSPPPPVPRSRRTGWRIRALDDIGLPFATMAQISLIVSTQVHGAALGLEAGTEALRTSDLSRDEWTANRQGAVELALSTGRLPMIARFGQSEYEASAPYRIFDFGLTRLLDGIAALIPAEAPGGIRGDLPRDRV